LKQLSGCEGGVIWVVDFNGTYPRAMRVFSDLVMILRSGRT